MEKWSDRLIDVFVIAVITCVLTLKITGYITIPWIWLLLPFWGSIMFFVVIFLFTLIRFLIETWYKKHIKKGE